MSSLFVSFDLKFFTMQILVYLAVFYILLNNFSFISSQKTLLYTIMEFLSKFFLSLKSFQFNKMILNFLLSIFILFLLLNLISVFPYNFPYTSQISIVFFVSFFFWSSIIFFYVMTNLKGFIIHLSPEGSPIVLSLLIFLIEISSNLIRPITLMIRLVANILAGHLLLILLSNLVFHYFNSFFFFLVLSSVELFVSIIQSYIFCTMMCLYYAELV